MMDVLADVPSFMNNTPLNRKKDVGLVDVVAVWRISDVLVALEAGVVTDCAFLIVCSIFWRAIRPF